LYSNGNENSDNNSNDSGCGSIEDRDVMIDLCRNGLLILNEVIYSDEKLYFEVYIRICDDLVNIINSYYQNTVKMEDRYYQIDMEIKNNC